MLAINKMESTVSLVDGSYFESLTDLFVIILMKNGVLIAVGNDPFNLANT